MRILMFLQNFLHLLRVALTNFMTQFLAKFMGEEKPQYPYGPPPGYMPPQAAPAPGPVAPGSAKQFFPISNSNRFFRV